MVSPQTVQEKTYHAVPADAGPPQECFRCGYDLRGQAQPGPCPECGHTPTA